MSGERIESTANATWRYFPEDPPSAAARARAVARARVLDEITLEPVQYDLSLSTTRRDLTPRVSRGGLVGLVGSREEPLNLEDAASHPRYRYFAETGEERYASFLGAPIIHHRRVMGVLVVQQKERRQFDEGEEAFLVTMSAQLAGVIAHAEATGSIRGLGRQGKGVQEAKFVGVPGAPGAAVGTAVVVLPPADLNVVPDRSVDDIAAELELFDKALGWVREDMQELSEKLATQLRKEERALFDVYLMMLEDAALGNEVRKIIRTGQWAQGALRQVVLDHVKRFERCAAAQAPGHLRIQVLAHLDDHIWIERQLRRNRLLLAFALAAPRVGIGCQQVHARFNQIGRPGQDAHQPHRFRAVSIVLHIAQDHLQRGIGADESG